jgi:hypothetical protein
MPIDKRRASRKVRTVLRMLAAVGVLAVWTSSGAAAQPASPHHQFIGGPWEVLVKMGLEGAGLRLPLSIADENKSQELGAVVPVAGTPLKVKLERYLPDLKWETTACEDPNGKPVVRLSLRGENLQQDLWLGARDRARQAITSHVGGVAIRELPGQADPAVLKGLAEPATVGILAVWLAETGTPLVYAVKPGTVITLPGSPWKLSVLRYMPHYSIDRTTKQVRNLSDKPENPALEVRVEGDRQEHQQWLWSQFAMVPHKQQQLPFRARFVDFHLEDGAGRYLLAVAPDRQCYLLYRQDGQKRLEAVAPGKRYPFDDKRYSFGVEEVWAAARIETVWKNGAAMLLHPAVVATISQGEAARQVVLELGQPCHHKTTVGTLVVLYRHVPES